MKTGNIELYGSVSAVSGPTKISGIVELTNQSRCRANRTDTQSINADASTKVQFATEIYDSQGEYDPTTNYRFTATRAGYYLVNMSLAYQTAEVGKSYYCRIYKNGVNISTNLQFASVASTFVVKNITIVDLIIGDYIEGYAYHNSTTAKNIDNDGTMCFIEVHKLS